ncbi:MAG: hypothetical protein ACKVP3_25995 [Hyphomicrobiaceae bacterium]
MGTVVSLRGWVCAGVAAAGLASLGAPDAVAQGPSCSRMQFEAAVSDAAGALRDLNAKNRPPFQEKLRALRDKRGWTHDQFLKEATPLVQDAKIAQYDKESGEFLEKIQSMGAVGASAKEPDCTRLTDVKTHMQALVASQQAKWTYMLQRVEQELAK